MVWDSIIGVVILSRARGAQFKGRSYAEVLHCKMCVLSSLSLGYHPGIGCREWVKGLGMVTKSLPEGQLKPRLLFFLSFTYHYNFYNYFFISIIDGLASREDLVH